ncbi:MAG: GAF domain-containing protein [Myxococcales bacterium]|nr:GAF domain-containing protein [Myxococcales bacterium]
MGIQTQSALISALLLLAIAINVFYRRRSVVHRWSFGALVTALFAYNFLFFLYGVTGESDWSLRLLLVCSTAAAHLVVRFYERFLGEPSSTMRLLTGGATGLTAVLAFTQIGDAPLFGTVVASWSLGVFLYAGVRLWARQRRATSEVERARLGYLVIGHVTALTFSGLDLLPFLGLEFPSLGHSLMTFYMYFWMQIVHRSRLLDLEELFGRALGLVVLAIPMSLIHTGLLVWTGDRLALFFFNAIVASVVIIFVYDPLREFVEDRISRLLFRESYEFAQLLHRLRAEVLNLIRPGDAVARVLDRLEQSRRVTHASIYLLEADGRGYGTQRAVGPVEAHRIDAIAGRPFLQALRRDGSVTLEAIERELAELGTEASGTAEGQRLTAIRGILRSISAGISFPCSSGERLLGVLNLADERLREPFSSHELQLIRSLASQIAVVLDNSEHFDRIKERERLSVIGEMAAGLAHEIRNPLGAIKGAGQLLEPERMDADHRELVEVILQEVDRLNVVVSQFLDYARPYRGTLSAVALGPIIDRMVTLLRAEAHTAPLAIEVSVDSGLPMVLADPSQLEQVLFNLTRNAIEAMPDGGTLTLRVQMLGRDSPYPRLQVEVSDTGTGIADEVLPHMFIPFFTTKGRGTGLGLAISQRIVQNHGGKIAVRSQLGVGTTVSLRLRSVEDNESTTGEFSLRPPVGS